MSIKLLMRSPGPVPALEPNTFVKLRKIRIKGNEKLCKIKKHPYYKSLKKKDSSMYEDYISKSKYQRKKETAIWTNFFSLYKIIKCKGFDFTTDPIIIKNKKGIWICCHGRHRMCMIHKIYGKKSIVELDSTGKVIRIINYK